MRSGGWTGGWALLLGMVLVGTAVAYLPALDGEPILDDSLAIGDPLVRWVVGAGPVAWISVSRPVTSAVFAANVALLGAAPRGLHAVNVGIHLLAVVLAWLLARETLRRAGLQQPDGPAVAGAAIFALHPLQTEAVAYVWQRSESLASVLYLAALILLLARDRAAGTRRMVLSAGALGLHALALGAKPMAATLPVVWLLHAAVFAPPGEEGLPTSRRLIRRWPLALPLVALSGLAAWLGLAGAAGGPHAGFSIPVYASASYAATQLRVVPSYVLLILWPAGQCGDWWVRVSRSWLEPEALGGAAAIAATVVAALVLRRRAADREGDGPALARVTSFGVLFFLIALLPSSSVVPLIDAKAEHRVYLALFGPALAMATGGAVILRRWAPRRALAAGMVVAVLVAGAAATATWRRCGVWATTLGFWTDAAAKSPEKARVHLNLGVALGYAGRRFASVQELLRAKALAGDGTVNEDVLLLNLVSGLLEIGLEREARAEVDAGLARDRSSSLAWSQAARLEYVAGRDELCERAAALALAAPEGRTGIKAHGLAAKWMGVARLRRGDLPGALEALRRAEREELWDDFQLYRALGEAELRAGSGAIGCQALARAAVIAASPAERGEAQRALAAAGCWDGLGR